ncbi:MAG: AAA family ATPase [Planctomycetota bacterium]
MLITAIRGENFMKFKRIALEKVPTQGVIGVEGRNEGGKSTVGELLQFAFFGKTTSSRAGSVLDLIRWDQDQCAVEVDFDVPGRGSFRVWREIDRYGTNYARLLAVPPGAASSLRSVRSGTTRSTDGLGASPTLATAPGAGTEVAAGTLQVHRELTNLLRFSYEDFLNSFYLEEQDFPRSPEQMRAYLDRIVGIEVFLRATDVVQREIADLEEEFANLQSSVKRNLLQVEKYLPNIARIPECEQAREEHVAQLENLRTAERELNQRVEDEERVGRDRELLRDRLRGLKELSASKLEASLEQVLRGYPEHVDGVLAGSKRELQRVRDRLTQVRQLVPRRAAVLAAVAAVRRELEEKLRGQGAGSFATRRRTVEQEVAVARSGERSAKTLGTVFVTASVLTGALAALLGFGVLGESPFGWDASRVRWVAIGVAGFAVLSFLVGILALRKRARLRGAAQEGDEQLAALVAEAQATEERLGPLSALDESVSFDDLPARAGTLRGDEVASALGGYLAQRETALAGAASLADLFGSLAEEENKVVQRLRSAAKEGKKDLQQNLEAQKREQSKRDRAEGEIREFQKQDGKRLALEEQNQQVREQVDRVRDEIDTRQLTLQLFQETIESVRQRTGPALGRAMRRLLPHVTAGRYTDLKITPDFHLQIFTSEKSDFLAPQELSGGTFEGLSFGFRLAFSQAFIRAVVRQPQFLFLDEPFKAMDRDRVHGTLAVLPRLSSDMPQIFVVLPGIAEPDRPLFDAIVTARVGDGELRFDGQPQPSSGEPRAALLADAHDGGLSHWATPSDAAAAQPAVAPEAAVPARDAATPSSAAAAADDRWERMIASRTPARSDDADSPPTS